MGKPKKKTISATPRKRSVKTILVTSTKRSAHLRDEIATAVLQGLYSNIADAQKFAAFAMGETMSLPEAFVRIAYQQADEAIRLRSL